jgi:hypothetical protein
VVQPEEGRPKAQSAHCWAMVDLAGMINSCLTQSYSNKWSEVRTAAFSTAISLTRPGEGLILRPLCTVELNRGFF